MAISAAYGGLGTGTESRRSSRPSEFWDITGATGVATDTVAITTRNFTKPLKCVGGMFTYTVSGGVITLTLKADIGNDVTSVEILGNY